MELPWIISFIGAFGLGAVITKLIDVLWLQRYLAEKEKRAWAREKRYEAFSSLSKVIIGLGFESGKKYDALEFMALSTPARLLLTNQELAERIGRFIISLDRYDKDFAEGKLSKKTVDIDGDSITESELRFLKIQDEGHKIITELSKELLK